MLKNFFVFFFLVRATFFCVRILSPHPRNYLKLNFYISQSKRDRPRPKTNEILTDLNRRLTAQELRVYLKNIRYRRVYYIRRVSNVLREQEKKKTRKVFNIRSFKRKIFTRDKLQTTSLLNKSSVYAVSFNFKCYFRDCTSIRSRNVIGTFVSNPIR